MNTKVGQLLADVRVGNGISQNTMAERMDTDKQYISNLENGHRNPTVKKIEEYLHAAEGKPEDVIIKRKKKPPAKKKPPKTKT